MPAASTSRSAMSQMMLANSSGAITLCLSPTLHKGVVDVPDTQLRQTGFDLADDRGDRSALLHDHRVGLVLTGGLERRELAVDQCRSHEVSGPLRQPAACFRSVDHKFDEADAAR